MRNLSHIDNFIREPHPEVVKLSGQKATLDALMFCCRAKVRKSVRTPSYVQQAKLEALAGINLVENKFFPIGVIGAFDKQNNIVKLYQL